MTSKDSNVKVSVAPQVLVWARETSNLRINTAAKRLKIKPETLVKMEEGHNPVTISKLRQMANVYDRPLIAFFLPEPPTEADRIPDFRVLDARESPRWSPELLKAYRRVVGQRQIAIALAAADNEPLPIVDVRLDVSDDEEDAGNRVRQWLDPPSLPGHDPYAILNGWIRRIEEKGVLVTQVSNIAIEEMRGFSISEHPLPVIALNGSEFPRGKLFTLLHELVHILLHRGALCDLADHPAAPRDEDQGLEWFCNSVAAAVLMPRQAVIEGVQSRGESASPGWPDDDLSRLAQTFGVSPEAMLVRLVRLQLVPWDVYRERRPRFLAQYQSRRQTGQGFLSYYRKQIRNLGRRYIATVWRAYERGELSDPDLSTYLQTKPEHIPRLIHEAGIDQ